VLIRSRRLCVDPIDVNAGSVDVPLISEKVLENGYRHALDDATRSDPELLLKLAKGTFVGGKVNTILKKQQVRMA
jgi:hypothetical protein